MKLNIFQLMQWGSQLGSALEAAQAEGSKVRGGDSALYIAARELAVRLERRNPGIAEQSGYSSRVSEL